MYQSRDKGIKYKDLNIRKIHLHCATDLNNPFNRLFILGEIKEGNHELQIVVGGNHPDIAAFDDRSFNANDGFGEYCPIKCFLRSDP